MPEKTPTPRKETKPHHDYACIACMDDDIRLGPKGLIVGLGGSGIYQLGGGNQEVFPDTVRQQLAEIQPAVTQALKTIAGRLGVPLVNTSHAGCGWAGTQGITPEKSQQLTQQQPITYAGHIRYAPQPQSLEKNVQACITRPEANHRHTATHVIITTGGFISQAEKDTLIAEKIGPHGKAFVISADWLTESRSEIDPIDAVLLISHQLDIAAAISLVEPSPNSVIIYNAGRLGQDQALVNRVETIIQAWAAQE